LQKNEQRNDKMTVSPSFLFLRFFMRQLKWILILFLCPAVVWGDETKTLTMDEALQIALEQNRTLKIAQARLKASEFGVKDARSAFLPHLAGRATYTRLDQAPYIDASNFSKMFEPLMAPFADLVAKGLLNPATLSGLQSASIDRIYIGMEDNYDFNLSLEQPLFSGGALWNSYRIAKLNSETELWNYRRDEDRVRYEVTEAFLNLVKARELERVTEESIQRVQAHLNDLENFRARGIGIERDLLKARVRLSNAQLQNVQAKNAVRLANARLCNLLSFDLETEVVPAKIPESCEDSLKVLSVYTDRAMEARPEMRAMNAGLLTAQRLIAIRKGEFLPKLLLLGNYDWKRPNREVEPEFYTTWNIGLALSLDLFHGGSRYYRLEQAKLALNQIEQNAHLLADGISLEVRQAYLAEEEAQKTFAIAEETVLQAQESYRVTQENFKAGIATNTDVLDAQNDLSQAQMQQIAAQMDLLLARARLSRASGG
jgi:outer membrane protein TolC